MKILGIDPGYATIGFGLVEVTRGIQSLHHYGTITTSKGLLFPARLRMIHDDMQELLNKLQPDEASMEELFFGHNVTTGIGVAHARGVILLVLEQRGIPVFEYKPVQVKQAVVGYGKAEKRQVMEMTRQILKMKEIARPDDAADAIAMALCHARSRTSLLREKNWMKEGG